MACTAYMSLLVRFVFWPANTHHMNVVSSATRQPGKRLRVFVVEQSCCLAPCALLVSVGTRLILGIHSTQSRMNREMCP